MRFRQGSTRFESKKRKAFRPSTMRTRPNRLGQSTVEFVVVFIAFLALVIAFGSIWRFGESGSLVEHALTSASHHLVISEIGGWGDVLSY